MQNVNINNIPSDSDYTADYKEIIIKCSTSEEAMDVLNNIHNNLAGNKDYIDCNIVLSDQFMDENTIQVAIFKECTTELDILSIKEK